jgi:DNA polymerase bacteriophage-type
MNEREHGQTFASGDLGWFDFECKSPIDLKSGTYRYACEALPIILAYGIGDGPACFVTRGFTPLTWADMPADFRAHDLRVAHGTAKWVAWNASFDKAIWNFATTDFPLMKPEHVIDAMVQAANSGLPPSLKMAARYAGCTAKVEEGRDLIKLFCLPNSTATPQSHPKEWQQFCEYARGDVVSMRETFWATRQLPLAEWHEYWAMERINERGVGVDLDMVKHATWLAHEDRRRSAVTLLELTGGRVGSVDEVAQITRWLLEQLPPEGREILVKREEEVDDEGKITRPAKYHLTRKQVERLIAYVAAEAPYLDKVMKVLQIRLYGGSKTPAKFAKIGVQHVDGTLFGQYVFSGAPQTGRASSKGVQIHNLAARDKLSFEHEAIEAILNSCSYEDLERLGDGSPVSRKLSLLIRPVFVPAANHLFVWSDWRNIEARITPWIADYLPGAAERLEIFRQVDADPSVPDIYTRTAADISHIPIVEVTSPIRQRGKVVELALTFLGGVGALHSMAAGYGMHFSDDEARLVVDRWRAANPWAIQFGNDLWDAMLLAWKIPGEVIQVGRVAFLFRYQDLGGSLLMILPSGRVLTYRALRWEMIEEKDDDDQVVGHKKALTYGRAHGRAQLWKGIFVENATQAVAADILRGTLRRLIDDGYDVRIHTHDECLLETHESYAVQTALELRKVMRQGFEWTEGLPIMSEEIVSPYYTKHESGKMPEEMPV